MGSALQPPFRIATKIRAAAKLSPQRLRAIARLYALLAASYVALGCAYLIPSHAMHAVGLVWFVFAFGMLLAAILMERRAKRA